MSPSTPDPRPAPPIPTRPVGNASRSLPPRVGGEGHGWVGFDLPGVLVGTAEYPDGPTGTTVVAVPDGARVAVDRRGGAVGVSGGFPYAHALCFAGGSSFGLAAATGVYDELLQRNGYATGFGQLPVVSGAVIYDFAPRDNAIYPDAELGRLALRAARPDAVATGRVGAGVSATVGKVVDERGEYAGQGAAFARVGRASVLVVTVVNAIGALVDRRGQVVRGNLDDHGVRQHPRIDYEARLSGLDLRPDQVVLPPGEGGNTTLTAVITDVVMDDTELGQFATQVHSSMARAIQPFHTIADGDTLFAVTTDRVDLGRVSLTLGSVASELAWDAVLSSAISPRRGGSGPR